MHASTIISALLHLLSITNSLICDLRHISRDPICLSSSIFTQFSPASKSTTDDANICEGSKAGTTQ